MEKKIAHLEFIQGVINRMGANSFMLKGWSVTLVAALLALSFATDQKIALIAISFIPVFVFCILDGYYLWQETLFRAVYDSVRIKDEDEIDFEMNPRDFVDSAKTWMAAIFSTTVFGFYFSLIAAMGLVIFILSKTL